MGNFASKQDIYTKTTSDNRFQTKGNYALTGSSYTKLESDGRYAGVGSSYTKPESDGLFQVKGSYASKTDLQNTINQINSMATIENVYNKTETDTTFLKKLEAANLYQPVGQYATVSFITDQLASLSKAVKTESLNIGNYNISLNDKQVCLGQTGTSKLFCFDGQFVTEK